MVMPRMTFAARFSAFCRVPVVQQLALGLSRWIVRLDLVPEGVDLLLVIGCLRNCFAVILARDPY